MVRFNIVAIALASVVALLPVAPPEHVHETADVQGHHHLVAHRHLTPHHPEKRDHGPIFDDRDPILTLEARFTVPARIATPTPAMTVVRVACPDVAIARTLHVSFGECLIHGPPRAPSTLRAPPSLTLL